MHALIIEDEPLIAMTIEEVLRECGFTSFDLASTADDAIACAERRCPHLITADVQLNPGSGVAAVNAICSGPPLPVIFVTGSPAEVTARMPLHPMILKPFRAEEIKAAVGLAMVKVTADLVEPA